MKTWQNTLKLIKLYKEVHWKKLFLGSLRASRAIKKIWILVTFGPIGRQDVSFRSETKATDAKMTWYTEEKSWKPDFRNSLIAPGDLKRLFH